MPPKTEDFKTGPVVGGNNLGWIQAKGRIEDDALRPGQRTDYLVTIKNLLPFNLGPIGGSPAIMLRVWIAPAGAAPDIAPPAGPFPAYNGSCVNLEVGEEETVHFLVHNPQQSPTGNFSIHTQIWRGGWPVWTTSNLNVGP